MVIKGAIAVNDLPQRHWKVELCMLDEAEKEIEIEIVARCTFYLHETFNDPVRSFDHPPFSVEEDGWGEFDIKIVCECIENGGKFTIHHPLTFDEPAYAIDYDIQVPCNAPVMRELLSKNCNLADLVKVEKPDKKLTVSHWIGQIATADEDTVTDIVQMIVAHPAVQEEINKRPRHEDFLMGFHQLPNDLLRKIGDYVCDGMAPKDAQNL